MLKNKKILLTIVLSVFIVIFGLFCYVVVKNINTGLTGQGEKNSPAIIYRNDKYGFEVKLPDGWKGFRVSESQKDIFGTNEEGIIGHFPEIDIVSPLSTANNPRQNIPIFIFTAEQWGHIGYEKVADWYVSAAPIPPSELGKNGKYVFALPARYNYAYLPGWEEVQRIIDTKPLTAF